VFMTETFGSAVIDTACTRTVCGKQWLENFMAYMREEDKAMVKVAPSAKTFRFGDGADVKSFQNVTIPAMIGETACNINTEVVDVDVDLSLLLSKASLKKAKTVLDLQNDTVTIFQKSVQLQYTSSGHYCVDIIKRDGSPGVTENSETVREYEVLMINVAKSEGELRKVLFKLHRQFGHGTAEKLKKLLQAAGVRDNRVFKLLEGFVKHHRGQL
jgi:hypothetical protein